MKMLVLIFFLSVGSFMTFPSLAEAGCVEWNYIAGGGMAGVYNPTAQKVEWNYIAGGGIAGVYDPNCPGH